MIGVICKHVVGWLPVPLVKQVTETVATAINVTGIIAYLKTINKSKLCLGAYVKSSLA